MLWVLSLPILWRNPAPDFPERSFYEVGGSQAAPKLRPLDLKEVKQLIEILFQTGHSPWISLPPVNQTASKLP